MKHHDWVTVIYIPQEGSSRSGCRPVFWVIHSHPFAVFSGGRRVEGALFVCFFFNKGINCIHNVNTSQDSHLQIPLHWELGFNMDLGEGWIQTLG